MRGDKSASAGSQERSKAKWRRPPANPTPEQVVSYRAEILRRIKRDPLAQKFLSTLTNKFGFSSDQIIGGLLDSAFHQLFATRKRLLESTDLKESDRKDLEYPSEGEWKENNPNPDLSLASKARELANAIEKGEVGTPAFGLNHLEQTAGWTESQLEQASEELNKLPATLRLYADYFEKTRKWWGIFGKIEIDARTKFQKLRRDMLQDLIRARTGHYSDERFNRLLNIALGVVGQPEIDRTALTMRRVRRQNQRKFSPEN